MSQEPIPRISDESSLTTEIHCAATLLDGLSRHLEASGMTEQAGQCVLRAAAIRQALEDVGRRLTDPSVKADWIIPCDVAVAPALIFSAGCPLFLILKALHERRRMGSPAYFPRSVLNRILPSEVFCGTAETLRVHADELDDTSALRGILLEGAQQIEAQAGQLREARALLASFVEVSESSVHSRAHRWLHRLPLDTDVPLELRRHPVDGRPMYGYTVDGLWVFDPRTTEGGRHAANPYQTYALTTRELGVLDRANERLANLLRLAGLAKTLPNPGLDQLDAEEDFFAALWTELPADKRDRLEVIPRDRTVETIDRALELLCEDPASTLHLQEK